MKNFFIKISGAVSAFFQKILKKTEVNSSNIPILYGPPNNRPSKRNIKKIRKKMAARSKNYGIQELYGIPQSMLNKVEDEEKQRHQKLYGPPPVINKDDNKEEK